MQIEIKGKKKKKRNKELRKDKGIYPRPHHTINQLTYLSN